MEPAPGTASFAFINCLTVLLTHVAPLLSKTPIVGCGRNFNRYRFVTVNSGSVINGNVIARAAFFLLIPAPGL
jgi:hypothetical protein